MGPRHGRGPEHDLPHAPVAAALRGGVLQGHPRPGALPLPEHRLVDGAGVAHVGGAAAEQPHRPGGGRERPGGHVARDPPPRGGAGDRDRPARGGLPLHAAVRGRPRARALWRGLLRLRGHRPPGVLPRGQGLGGRGLLQGRRAAPRPALGGRLRGPRRPPALPPRRGRARRRLLQRRDRGGHRPAEPLLQVPLLGPGRPPQRHHRRSPSDAPLQRPLARGRGLALLLPRMDPGVPGRGQEPRLLRRRPQHLPQLRLLVRLQLLPDTRLPRAPPARGDAGVLEGLLPAPRRPSPSRFPRQRVCDRCDPIGA
mmetsp:Transcript_102223/g.286567  ORF Transcript_102223/g.286567 Transcript_102223/m.286567 type:complete len:311 (+) Transcript_102223:550-1482(+)